MGLYRKTLLFVNYSLIKNGPHWGVIFTFYVKICSENLALIFQIRTLHIRKSGSYVIGYPLHWKGKNGQTKF